MNQSTITNYWRAVLPHYEVDQGTYFFTIRCAGSLPRSVGLELEKSRQFLEQCEYDSERWREAHRRMFATMEKYLDEGSGFCPFRNHQCAAVIVQELDKLQDQGWPVTHFSIMPNHLHLLVKVDKESLPMKEVWTAWKGRTGRLCNLYLQRQGPFWQRDWFDRWMREEQSVAKVAEYIRQNPVKAGIVEKWEEYPWVK